MTTNETADARTESSVQNFGDMLSAARVAKKMEAAEIAQALKLPLEKILTIEKSDIHSLPPAAFTSGYLRAYAKLVGVSENDIMVSYNRLSGNSPEMKMPGAVSDLPVQATSDHLGMRIVSYSLISLIVVLFILWIQGNDNKTDAVKSAESSIDAPAPAITDMPVAEQESEFNLSAQGEGSVDPVKPLPESGDVNAEDTNTENQQPETSPEVEETAEPELVKESRVANPVAPLGNDILNLTANADCWGDIVDANDHLLYRSLLKAGNEVELKGQAPFRVFLGDASAISLSINNIAYDITPHIRGNRTARFDISEKKALKEARAKPPITPKEDTPENSDVVDGGNRPAELSPDVVSE